MYIVSCHIEAKDCCADLWDMCVVSPALNVNFRPSLLLVCMDSSHNYYHPLFCPLWVMMPSCIHVTLWFEECLNACTTLVLSPR